MYRLHKVINNQYLFGLFFFCRIMLNCLCELVYRESALLSCMELEKFIT